MSKKLKKDAKKVSKEFVEGCNYMRDLYTIALIEIFGKKAGAKASTYLIEKTVKLKPKKKK